MIQGTPMAKVTEQDLIKLGFVKDGFPYRLTIHHSILGNIIIETSSNLTSVALIIKDQLVYLDDLTNANIDLFIRFAKGEKL